MNSDAVHSMRRARSAQRGFTLMELMIVVAIIGILCAIALASYQSSVIKSRRAAAATCLQERAQFMERFYTTKMTYTGAPDPVQCDGSVKTFYTIAYDGTPAGNAFKVKATPQGQQLEKDLKCGTLSIDQKGARTVSGTGTETDCW